MHTVKARSLHHELADGFDIFRKRGRGRYDMELSHFDTPEFSFLTNTRSAAWMPIVHKILGEDVLLVHKGCFMSLPGAESQVYHQDGVHLNQKVHKPCYAINVFIPLVDYNKTNGPTEFCLGSHHLGHENFVKENTYVPLVKAGTPVIFDYRLGHRGLRNYSDAVRPVVYLTYSSVASGKEFRDSVNFSRKRFRKLGDFVETPLSRDERRRKRCMEKTAAAPIAVPAAAPLVTPTAAPVASFLE
jgi:ectoine hydroxylase-related dioxygenase (phytanoyl-CoA dioxygenase family)